METMKKISSFAPNGRGGKSIADRPTDDLVMALAAPKGPNLGRKSNAQDARENQASAKDQEVLGELASGDRAIDLSMESASSLPALFDTPAESFATMAQAQTKAQESTAKTAPDTKTKAEEPAAKTTSFFESASATQIGAIALGVIAVGAAASSGGGSGGGSSGGGSTPQKVVAAPTVAPGTDGVITVTLAGDAVRAKLFSDGKEITDNFNAETTAATPTTPSKVTFRPKVDKVEYNAKTITATAVDATGVSSADSLSISYTFDKKPPAAPPTEVSFDSKGVIKASVGSDATSVKIFADGKDVTKAEFIEVSGTPLTFTPRVDKVQYDGKELQLKAVDAAGNESTTATKLTYTFDKIPPPAPTLKAGANGKIEVTVAEDVTALKISAGSDNIGENFKIDSVSGTLDILTPKPGSFNGESRSITIVALDKAGNSSPASGALTYILDNTPPAAAPTEVKVDDKTGVITMSVGSDATTAQLFDAKGSDITGLFKVTNSKGSVTVAPSKGEVEISGDISIKSADAAGNASEAKVTQTYAFDNIAPPAPSKIEVDPTNGNVKVTIGTIGQPVPGTVKLLSGKTDITDKYVPDTKVAGEVTFAPVSGQVVPSNQTLTATVADAKGNESVESKAAVLPTLRTTNIDAESAGKAPDGFAASDAKDLFNVDTSSTYSTKVTGFGLGDKLVFKGVPTPFNFTNKDFSDNQATIETVVGAISVKLTLTNLPSGADSAMVSEEEVNRFFGPGSLSFNSGTTAEPKTTQAIDGNSFAGPAGKGFDAAGSSVAYTISDGAFESTIANFAFGDSIAFVSNGAAPTLNYENTFGDGLVLIKGSFASGNIAQITLKGRAAADVEQIYSDADFEDAFGPGSLTSVGQAGSQAVDVTADKNGGPGGFTASNGNFAFNIGVGEYNTTINGFGKGDSLSFFGSTKIASLSFKNNSETDGVVIVTGIVDGKPVQVTVGVGTGFDNKLYGFDDFNDTFGPGTLIA
jgi:hypothetical protein